MFGTRLASLILAFCLGFSMCGGLIAFGTMAAISKFKVRDLEKHGIEIPDEAFMTENPEVDLLNLSIVDFINEVKYISSISNEANLNDVQERYGLIFHEKLDALLSDETREMPLKQLFSKEGFGHILGSVYIGNIENYTCYDAEGNVGGDPKDDTSYWMTADGVKITGIEDIIADFSLNDFISGNINTNNLFDDICIGDIFGYTKNGEEWYDKDGNKVTGVIGALADSKIDGVGEQIEQIEVGKLLGYEKIEGVWYQPADVIGDDGGRVPVNGFMSKISDSTINNMDGVFDTLVIGDVVKDTDEGLFSIIDPDTKIDEIGSAVNDSIMDSPLQFFINKKLISFETGEGEDKQDMSETLDFMSTNDLAKIYPTDEDFNTQKNYYSGVWTEVKSGDTVLYYTVPNWRTQPLSTSFAYIIKLFATPSLPLSE